MAVAALLLWLGTAAVGSYLLATSVRSANTRPRFGGTGGEPAPVPAEQPAAAAATSVPAPQRPTRARDRFDPPSLQRAKSQPMPGLKELAEFAHPALAMIGFGFWLGYAVSRDRLFAVISLGIALGTIAAGLSWFAAGTRAGRGPGAATLSPSPRLLILHAIGAALTLLFAVLTAVRA